MQRVGPGVRRLDAGNVYVHRAVRAVAAGARPPEPPTELTWARRAGEHGVLSVLAEHLQPRADGYLRRVRVTRAASYLRMVADLRFVADVLGAASLEWLVFKGPVLSEVVYQRPGARNCRDLDVLVRPEDVDATVDLLLAAGASPLHEDWRALRALGDGECEFRLPNGTQIDLHWDVINEGWVRPGFAVPADKLFAQSRAVAIDGLVVRTFGTADTVLHLALHGCRSGGDRLRWLLDLQQSLLRWDGCADELVERARGLRLELVLRCMLNRLSMFLGESPVPLPRPTRAHRAWLAADTAMMSRYPPGSRHEGRPSGELLTCATRSGTARSITALVQAAPRVARERWAIRRGWAQPPHPAPL